MTRAAPAADLRQPGPRSLDRGAGIAGSAAAVIAIAGPALLAFNVPPSATFLNQAIALAGWGIFTGLLMAAPERSGIRWPTGRGLWAVLAALALMFLSALGAACGSSALPWGLALSSAGLIAATAVVFIAGAAGQSAGQGDAAFLPFCRGLLVAGALSVVVALVQYFAPDWADGNWIARSGGGRVGGNLRQPNHLSSLLLWSLVALVWLHEAGSAPWSHLSRPTGRALSVAAWVALVFGVVLTVSRTGTVCVVLMALWGAADRRLSSFVRVMLCLTPLVYVLGWIGLAEWAQAHLLAFAGSEQLHKADPSSSRFAIWSNTLDLIRAHPWFGVGWGEFNFAWSLTPFPGRPGAFFDHTHNLPLQLMVEMGIPLAVVVMGLLLLAMWRGWKACLRIAGSATPTTHCAFVMVLMMGVHSMLEYPLWYAYFLLPTAYAFGVCLARGEGTAPAAAGSSVPPPSAVSWPARVVFSASMAVVVGATLSVSDYLRVVAIFAPGDGAAPLADRIADGQRSWFFAHHADYAAATTAERPSEAMQAFDRAPHYLLDTRLMMAWARAYDEAGDVQRARYLAQRLREFHNPQSEEFFGKCLEPSRAGEPTPFQCVPPDTAYTYRDFRRR